MFRVTVTLDFQGDKLCPVCVLGNSYVSGTVCIRLGELVNKADTALLPRGLQSCRDSQRLCLKSFFLHFLEHTLLFPTSDWNPCTCTHSVLPLPARLFSFLLAANYEQPQTVNHYKAMEMTVEIEG